ncbi:MAG: phosphatidylinositol mannoside acyltransferase [Actinomycetota bacterium]|nr:phosphatidylinositol mannoside acyltransferase [Actinomycetota bacterium]
MLSKSRTTYLSYRSLAAALELFPRPIADVIAVASGRLMYQVWKDKHPVVRANLRRVLGPGVTEDELDEAVVKAFDSYARYWVESARLATIRPSEVLRRMTTIGFESATREIDSGRGAILGLTHTGSWDIGGYWLTLQGTPLVTVTEPVEPPELFAWFREQRELMGLTVLPLGRETSTQLLSALRSGRLVGLLCDRDISGNGVEVEFFGEKTTLPVGPAVLSLRTGAPIIPASVYQEPGGMHRGVMRPALRFERTGDLRADATALTQLLAHELEQLIRWAPTQWHAFQPIWPSDFPAAGRAAPSRA